MTLVNGRSNINVLKPVFHLATLFARREAKTRIRQRDWLKLAGEKIRREQLGTVPTFLSVRANKFAKWKIGLMTFWNSGVQSVVQSLSIIHNYQWFNHQGSVVRKVSSSIHQLNSWI